MAVLVNFFHLRDNHHMMIMKIRRETRGGSATKSWRKRENRRRRIEKRR
jgi:hypothetical protein